MDRFVILQVAFNLVLLANILYLHRARVAAARATGATGRPGVTVPSPPKQREAKAPRRPRGFVLTLGLRGGSPGRKPAEGSAPAEAAPPTGGVELESLIAQAEREEAISAPSTADASRQRAADDLRAGIRRLQARLDDARGAETPGARSYGL